MKIIYKFDDGSTSEVEVDEELGAFISAEERKEENRQRSYKRKFIAYESFVYEGHEFGYEEDFLDLIVYENELDKVIDTITKLIEPFMLIVIGAMVLFIALSLYLPLFQSYQT